MLRQAFIALAVLFLLVPRPGLAQDAPSPDQNVPDLTGHWVTTESTSVARGPLGPEHPDQVGVTYASPSLTLDITRRQGRVFEATSVGPMGEQLHVGGVAQDNVTVWLVVQDGLAQARLVSPDLMEMIFVREGPVTDIVSVSRWERR